MACREAFVALNDPVFARLAERGHGDVRTEHGAVFQWLDETGSERVEALRADLDTIREIAASVDQP